MMLRWILTFPMFLLLGTAATAAERPGEQGEHDFHDSVIVFTLEYEDDLLPAPPWALAKARIQRLGNLFFLTGIQPDGLNIPGAGGAEPPAARRHWIPLGDIVRMAEYDDVESALRALEIDEAADDEARPVVRRVSGKGQRRERERTAK